MENEGDIQKETVTFLYKLTEGVCPKSYGFNVARLAGLPASIVKHAHDIAKQLETVVKNRKIVQNLLKATSVLQAKEILAALEN